MTRHRRPTIAAAAAILAAGALAACGNVDSADLEEQLRTDLSADVGVNPDEVSVECPDDIPAEQGEEFECDLTAPNGDNVIVEVVLTDDDGSFEANVPQEQFQQQ